MRIAQIAPLFESVPPRLYGGTERVVYYFAIERGTDESLAPYALWAARALRGFNSAVPAQSLSAVF
jgi:hypothetical protein